MQTQLCLICYRRQFGQIFLASYWPGQHALASHWLAEFAIANSTPTYLITDQSWLLGVSQAPAEIQSNFVIGQLYSTCD
jgi:hypothetical protein